jgi:hypothetical protein
MKDLKYKRCPITIDQRGRLVALQRVIFASPGVILEIKAAKALKDIISNQKAVSDGRS